MTKKFVLVAALLVAHCCHSATWRLCVLVDSSEGMVNTRAYDSVLSTLETQLLTANYQKMTIEPYQVSIVAFGVQKPEMLSTKRLYLSDARKEYDKASISKAPLPRVFESAITHEAFKPAFQRDLDGKIKLNDGVIVISDRSEIENINSREKYYRNILVKISDVPGRAVPVPNLDKLSSDVRTAFEDFFKYVDDGALLSDIVVTPETKGGMLVGETGRFHVKWGKNFETRGVKIYRSDRLVRDVAVNKNDPGEVFEYAFPEEGRYRLVFRTTRGDKFKETPGLDVDVAQPPAIGAIVCQPKGTAYVGQPVKVKVSLQNASVARVDFGDGSPAENCLKDGNEHRYKKADQFTIKVSAENGSGRALPRELPIAIVEPPKIWLDCEQVGADVRVTVHAPNATSASVDFDDGVVENELRDGAVVPHSYSRGVTDKTFTIRLKAQMSGCDVEDYTKEITVAGQPPPPPVAVPKPTVALTLPDQQVYVGDEAVFGVRISNASRATVDFGDATKKDLNVAQGSVVHTYSAEREYTCTVTAYGKGNVSTSATLRVNAVDKPADLPELSIRVPSECVVGEPVSIKVVFTNVTDVTVVCGKGSKSIDYAREARKTGLVHTFADEGDKEISVTAVNMRGESFGPVTKVIRVSPRSGPWFLYLLVALAVGVVLVKLNPFKARTVMRLAFEPRSEAQQASAVDVTNRSPATFEAEGFPHRLHVRYVSGKSSGGSDGFRLTSSDDLWILGGAIEERQQLRHDAGEKLEFDTKYEIFFGQLAKEPLGSFEGKLS